MTPLQDDFTGMLIAERYQVGQCLRRSDLQRLYRAQDINTGAAVHLKVLYPARAADEQFRIGFKRQVSRIGSIAHPNVLVPSDYGFFNDLPYIITPAFAGVSLRDELQLEGRFPLSRVTELAEQIADALGAGHAAGVIHGTLTAHSVVVVGGFSESEQAYILDFGLSHLFTADDSGSSMTESGKLIGDPEYMAPEQIRGQHISPATDIYALGSIVYELLCGRVPFPITGSGADAVMDVLMRQVGDPVPAFPESLDLGKEVQEIVLQALHKEQEQRPTTVAMFIRRLSEASSELSSDFSLPPASEHMLVDEPYPNSFESDQFTFEEQSTKQTVDFNQTEEQVRSFASTLTDQPVVSQFQRSSRDTRTTIITDEDLLADGSDFGVLESAPENEASEPTVAPSAESAAYDWLKAVREEEQERGIPSAAYVSSDEDPFAVPEDLPSYEGTFDLPSFNAGVGRTIPEATFGEAGDDDFAAAWEEHEEQPKKKAKPVKEKKEKRERSASDYRKPNKSLIGKLVPALIGICVVALAVVAAGIYFKRSKPETTAEVASTAMTEEAKELPNDSEPDSQTTTSEDPSETPQAVEPGELPTPESQDATTPEPVGDQATPDVAVEPEQDSPSAELKFGKVDLESVILRSRAGKALASQYEKAYRAVSDRPNRAPLMEELHKRMTQAVREIRLDIEAVIDQYGASKGYGLIVGKEVPPKSSLYVRDSINPEQFMKESGAATDISKEILDAYNAQSAE